MQNIITLGLIAGVILLGFIGNLIFKKSNIPNILWLLLFGLLLGQVLNIVDRGSFLQMTDLISSLAIIIILSSGGMELDLIETIKSAPIGLSILIIGMLFSIGSVFLIMLLFGFSWELALFAGLTLSGTSASVVMPIVTKIEGLDKKVKSILSFESIADTFTIVLALLLLDYMTGKILSLDVPAFILPVISGLSIGILVGILWMVLLEKIKDYDYTYAATLAVLILTYVMSEYIEASGAIACFTAGLTIGNYTLLKNMSGDTKKRTLKHEMDTFRYHSLVSFFIRSFFFVFVGSIVLIKNYQAVMIGSLICIGFLITRYVYIKYLFRNNNLKDFDKNIMIIMFPRGLSAAVLATVPLTRGHTRF